MLGSPRTSPHPSSGRGDPEALIPWHLCMSHMKSGVSLQPENSQAERVSTLGMYEALR